MVDAAVVAVRVVAVAGAARAAVTGMTPRAVATSRNRMAGRVVRFELVFMVSPFGHPIDAGRGAG